MKRNLTVTKSILGIIGLTFMLSSCSTWHYKHPRVRIEGEDPVYSQMKEERPNDLTIMTTAEEPGNKQIKTGPVADPRLVTEQSDKFYLTDRNAPKSSVVKETTLKNTNSPLKLFANHVKTHKNGTCNAQSVEKTAATGWVRIMIILFVVGFILLLIGIFLSVFVFGGFWWLFYAFGALLILAGVIVLILGLLGLI
jgi:hypothetical protein